VAMFTSGALSFVVIAMCLVVRFVVR